MILMMTMIRTEIITMITMIAMITVLTKLHCLLIHLLLAKLMSIIAISMPKNAAGKMEWFFRFKNEIFATLRSYAYRAVSSSFLIT